MRTIIDFITILNFVEKLASPDVLGASSPVRVGIIGNTHFFQIPGIFSIFRPHRRRQKGRKADHPNRDCQCAWSSCALVDDYLLCAADPDSEDGRAGETGQQRALDARI
jgi:hypothetical protein